MTRALIRPNDIGSMVCSWSKTVVRLLLLASVWLAVLPCSFHSIAGEKIQITPRSSRSNSAAETIKNGLYSDPLGFIKSRGGSGAGSLVPNLPPPTSTRRARPKNGDTEDWMLDADGNIDQAAALNKIFGIRDYNNFDKTKNRQGNGKKTGLENELDSLSGSPRKNWFETAYRKTQRESAKGLTPEADDEPNSPFEEDSEDSSIARRPELNLNSFLLPQQSNEVISASTRGQIKDPFSFNGFSQSLRQTESGRFGRTKEQEEQFLDFQKMLGAQPTLFVDQLNNALSSLPDATRQGLNPVKGQTVERLSPFGVNPSDMNMGLSGAPIAAPSSQMFESFNTRILEKTSLSPAMILPPPVPVFQPRPSILEIPRRKF